MPRAVPTKQSLRECNFTFGRFVRPCANIAGCEFNSEHPTGKIAGALAVRFAVAVE
jgi:hypothetical protein